MDFGPMKSVMTRASSAVSMAAETAKSGNTGVCLGDFWMDPDSCITDMMAAPLVLRVLCGSRWRRRRRGGFACSCNSIGIVVGRVGVMVAGGAMCGCGQASGVE
ncbi:hypothetical protein LBMAG48_28560 [Phycisphaerae bacterium]|nr:hypothetical protein LBMAG48_28560 [Phycisphaerae bacterium]